MVAALTGAFSTYFIVTISIWRQAAHDKFEVLSLQERAVKNFFLRINLMGFTLKCLLTHQEPERQSDHFPRAFDRSSQVNKSSGGASIKVILIEVILLRR